MKTLTLSQIEDKFGLHVTMSDMGSYFKTQDTIVALSVAQKEIDQKDERIKELEKENRKLSAAFHQMKNNAKQLFDMSNRFNSSIESNLIMAKDWCDDLCGTKKDKQ